MISALTAAFHCAAPARCAALVDEGRVVHGDGGGPTKADARRSASRVGQCCPATADAGGTGSGSPPKCRPLL
jgi:hypothetical protein